MIYETLLPYSEVSLLVLPLQRPSCPTRRATNSEHISFHDSDPTIGMMRPGSDVFGPRYYRHVRHRSPEGLAEVWLYSSS